MKEGWLLFWTHVFPWGWINGDDMTPWRSVGFVSAVIVYGVLVDVVNHVIVKPMWRWLQ